MMDEFAVICPGVLLPFGPQLVGWLFVFATTEPRVILFGLEVLALGGVAFLGWSWRTGGWPFGEGDAPPQVPGGPAPVASST